MADKILVLGSTGTIARSVVTGLAKSGAHVLAATRKPSRAGFDELQNVQTIGLNLSEPDGFAQALDRVDRVFAMIPGDLLVAKPGAPAADVLLEEFVSVATRDRKRKVVVMSVGGIEYDEDFPHRKLELAVERSGAPYVFIRPNWFMANFHTIWQAPIRDMSILAVPAAGAKASFVDPRDISASIVSALQTSDFDGQAISVTGPEAIGFAETTAILSEALGRTISYIPLEDAQFIDMLANVGVPREAATYVAHSFGRMREGMASSTSDGVERLTGNAPRPFRQYVGDHTAYWTK